MNNFQYHLTEKTMRELLRDPQLPDNPSFTELRQALARLDAKTPEPIDTDTKEQALILLARIAGNCASAKDALEFFGEHGLSISRITKKWREAQ